MKNICGKCEPHGQSEYCTRSYVRREKVQHFSPGVWFYSVREHQVKCLISLHGNWEAARTASSSSSLASVCFIPSMSAVSLAMQTEIMAIFASITSAQDIRAPFTDAERTPT